MIFVKKIRMTQTKMKNSRAAVRMAAMIALVFHAVNFIKEGGTAPPSFRRLS